MPYLVDVEEEDGQVEEDDDDEGQDEDDGQRGENPQQVLHHAQVVLHVGQASPLLQGVEHTHLSAAAQKTSIKRVRRCGEFNDRQGRSKAGFRALKALKEKTTTNTYIKKYISIRIVTMIIIIIKNANFYFSGNDSKSC